MEHPDLRDNLPSLPRTSVRRLGRMAILAPLAILLALVLLAQLSAPQTAAATADACGTSVFDVPDSSPVFDFAPACAAHDACLTARGGDSVPRKPCDDAFYRDMTASCDAMWPQLSTNALLCRLASSLYYIGVRLGGWLFF